MEDIIPYKCLEESLRYKGQEERKTRYISFIVYLSYTNYVFIVFFKSQTIVLLLQAALMPPAVQQVQFLLPCLEVLSWNILVKAITCIQLVELRGQVLAAAALIRGGNFSVQTENLKKQEDPGTEKSRCCRWEGAPLWCHFHWPKCYFCPPYRCQAVYQICPVVTG